MKVLVSCTEYSIIIDLKEASLWEWVTCLEEQYPLEEGILRSASKTKKENGK